MGTLLSWFFGLFCDLLLWLDGGFAVLFEHELEPLLLLIPLSIDVGLDLVHLLDNGGVLGELIALVQIVEPQLNIRRISINVLQVCLRFLVIGLSSLSDLQGLFCAVDCVLLFV